MLLLDHNESNDLHDKLHHQCSNQVPWVRSRALPSQDTPRTRYHRPCHIGTSGNLHLDQCCWQKFRQPEGRINERNEKQHQSTNRHDDVIKWKHFPRYWPFVRGIHRSPVNSPHKGQWRGPLMFSLICVWINGWVDNREAGDLRCYHAHYGVTVMVTWPPLIWNHLSYFITNGRIIDNIKYIPQNIRQAKHCFLVLNNTVKLMSSVEITFKAILYNLLEEVSYIRNPKCTLGIIANIKTISCYQRAILKCHLHLKLHLTYPVSNGVLFTPFFKQVA